MTHIQLIGFARFDQRLDQLNGVRKVHVLVHQAVNYQQSILSVRQREDMRDIIIIDTIQDILVGKGVDMRHNVSQSVAFGVVLGRRHIALGIARVVELPISDGRARYGTLENVWPLG